MDSLIALSGKDFVLMAADVTSARSIVIMKEDTDKIMELDEHKLLGFAGEQGDCAAFTEYIQKNVHLFALRSGITLDTHAVGNFTRNELAVALRYVEWAVGPEGWGGGGGCTVPTGGERSVAGPLLTDARSAVRWPGADGSFAEGRWSGR